MPDNSLEQQEVTRVVVLTSLRDNGDPDDPAAEDAESLRSVLVVGRLDSLSVECNIYAPTILHVFLNL